jgi:hypothetical protein
MSVQKHGLLGGWYPRRLIVHQQRYWPVIMQSNENVDIKLSVHKVCSKSNDWENMLWIEENCKDIKEVIRIRKSKERQYNGQMKNDIKTSNDLQTLHRKLKIDTNLTKNWGLTRVIRKVQYHISCISQPLSVPSRIVQKKNERHVHNSKVYLVECASTYKIGVYVTVDL